MQHSKVRGLGGRRKPAIRAGLLAVASASAGVLGTASVGFGVLGTPITTITGWNCQQIYTGPGSVNAAFDSASNFDYYTLGATGNTTGEGLPNSGAITDAAATTIKFQLQPYTGNDALELQAVSGSAAPYGPNGQNAVLSGTLTFPGTTAYSTLSVLSAIGNGGTTAANKISYTINYTSGQTSTGTYAGIDWFTGASNAVTGVGRVSPAVGGASPTFNAGTQPYIYNNNLTIPAGLTTIPITSITFSIPGQASGNGPEFTVFALAGNASTPASTVYTYNASTNPNVFDTVTANFLLSGSTTNTTFVSGNSSTGLFTDSAPSTNGTHTVSVAAGNISALLVQFNNSSTSYTLTGPGSLTGGGGLSVTGGGTVTLTNSNTFTGATSVTAGTLNLNSGAGIASTTISVSGGVLNLNTGASVSSPAFTVSSGTFNLNSGASLTNASTTVSVGSGATFNLASGAVLSGTSLTLANSGTVNSSVSSLALNSLTGTGVVNLNTTALSLPNTTFTGTIGGTSGSVIFPGIGTFAGTLTGGIGVMKTVGGNQVLSGSNTYTGGTSVTAGTLTVSTASALGSAASTITLGGGTLALGGGTPVAVQVLNGFGSFATGNGVELSNGNSPQPATVSGSTLTLTHNNPHSNASIFTSSPVALNLTNGFTVSFLYTPNDPNNSSTYPADGAAFVLQNDPNKTLALGDGGGAVGYIGGTDPGYTTGLQNSFAAILGIYEYNYSSDAAFSTDGNAFTYQSTTPQVNQQPDQVTISYNGSSHIVTFIIANANSLTSSTTLTDSVNLATVLGGTTAYVGFTGGEGDGSAQQLIQNFTMSNYVSGPVGIPQAVVTTPNTSSGLLVSVATGSNTESIGALNISSGSKLALTTTTGSIGVVVLNPASLSIAGTAGSFTGQLDIGKNDLDIPASAITTLTGVTAMVKQGYASGTWTGNGITSSIAAADTAHLTAVGVITNDNGQGTGTPLYGVNGTISSTFDGNAAAADGDILVKYTYYGDCNLDGAVDGSDYSLIDAAYLSENFTGSVMKGPAATGWYNGDFNYDGVVNGSDYTLLDNAFNQQGSSLGVNPLAQTAISTALVAGGSAVPEPSTLALLLIGSAATLGRRRRRD